MDQLVFSDFAYDELSLLKTDEWKTAYNAAKSYVKICWK